jgi:hypothetical protein
MSSDHTCTYTCRPTSRVPAVLLRGNSTNVYVTHQSLLPESLSYPDNSIHIIEFHKKNYYSSTQHLHRNSNPEVFLVCNLCSWILPAESNNFILGPVLLLCLVTQLQEPSSPQIEHRTDSQGHDLCPVISSLKQTALVLAPFFYRAYFSSYRNHPHRDSNSGHFRSFNLSEISSWFQGISMPNLV